MKLKFCILLLSHFGLSFPSECENLVLNELEYMIGASSVWRPYQSFEHEIILSDAILKEIKLLLQETNPLLIPEIGSCNPAIYARSPSLTHYISLEVKKKIKDCLGKHIFHRKSELQ